MELEGIEVAVATKKIVASDDTKSRDYRVDSAARSHSPRAERAMVTRSRNRDFMTTHRAKLERGENRSCTPEVDLGGEALQHFGQNQIPDQDPRFGRLVESISRGGWPAVEIVDPNGGIDNRHRRGLRSRRM